MKSYSTREMQLIYKVFLLININDCRPINDYKYFWNNESDIVKENIGRLLKEIKEWKNDESNSSLYDNDKNSFRWIVYNLKKDIGNDSSNFKNPHFFDDCFESNNYDNDNNFKIIHEANTEFDFVSYSEIISNSFKK